MSRVAELNRIDLTRDTQGMMNVLKSIGAWLIIPMHILSNSMAELCDILARCIACGSALIAGIGQWAC
jgi:hypothetical protein